MRNFQEELGSGSKQPTRQTKGPLEPVAAALGVDSRDLYRAIIGIVAVGAIIAAVLVVSFTSGGGSAASAEKVPKAVVVVVPGWNAVLAESAIASNKASSLAGFVTSGAAYARIQSNSTDTTAALETILTGTPVSFHNVTDRTALGAAQSSMIPSFLKYFTDASLHTTLIASADYYSGSTYNDAGVCDTVGILDAECNGIACPTSATQYCNAPQRRIVSNETSALMGTTISDAVSSVAAGSSLVAIIVNTFGSMQNDDDNSLKALSATSLLDGVVGQIVLAVSERSYEAKENWLVLVTGDGVNAAQQAPLFVVPITAGSVSKAKAVDAAVANIANVFITLTQWFGIPAPTTVVGSALGLCGSGKSVTAC